MAKFIIDTLGSDNGYGELVKGSIQAIEAYDDLELILVGPKDKLSEALGDFNHHISIVDAPNVITNNENPLMGIRTKKDASISVSLNLLKNDSSIDGLVTAGSTGALICGSILILSNSPLNKPVLTSVLPNDCGGSFCLLDCGANIDSTCEDLVYFADVANNFVKSYLHIESPRIALLSNGTEENKGDKRTKEAFQLLKETNLNFVGNIEGSAVLNNKCDIVVTDGFSGNIVLKNIEGTAKTIIKDLYKELKSTTDPLKQEVLKTSIDNLLKKYDFNGLGGAFLLGFDKIIIKAHGACVAGSIKAIIGQAYLRISNK